MKISLKVKKTPNNQKTKAEIWSSSISCWICSCLQAQWCYKRTLVSILWNWSLSTQGTNWDTAKLWKIMSIVPFFCLKEKAVWGRSCGLGKLAGACDTCQILSPNLRSWFPCLGWQCPDPLVLSSSWDIEITLTNCPFPWVCSASDYWAIHARSWTRGISSATQSSPLNNLCCLMGFVPSFCANL